MWEKTVHWNPPLISAVSHFICFSQLLQQGQTYKLCWTNPLVKSELNNHHMEVKQKKSGVLSSCTQSCRPFVPEDLYTLASLLPSGCVLKNFKFMGKGEGAWRRGSLLKGFLHCTTSTSGDAQTHPFCTAESNGERLEIVHNISHTHCREGRDWQVGNPSAQSIDCSPRLVANTKHSIAR